MAPPITQNSPTSVVMSKNGITLKTPLSGILEYDSIDTSLCQTKFKLKIIPQL